MSLLQGARMLVDGALRYRRECSVEGWRKALGERLSIGPGADVSRARLVVREREGVRCSIAQGCDVRALMVLERQGASILIGARTHLGGGTLLDAADRIELGEDVLVAFDVLITDNDSHSLRFNERANDASDWAKGRKDWSRVPANPVLVESKAWIGARAIILKGVTIGEGAVIGAGSVVTQSIPAWTLAAGNPARVVRDLPR